MLLSPPPTKSKEPQFDFARVCSRRPLRPAVRLLEGRSRLVAATRSMDARMTHIHHIRAAVFRR